MRIDKYIWTVRLSKTRSLATKLCTAEKVKLNGEFVKGAKNVKVGHEIAIKNQPIWRTYKVLDLPKSRLGAKLVPEYLVETTPEEELEILSQIEETNRQNRMLGIRGRPTKRDRRSWDKYIR